MIIKYFAWIKNITGIEEEIITEKSIKDIKTLKNFLLIKYPKLKKYILEEKVICVAINLELKTKNEKIELNDEIAIFPPVSGG